MAGIPTNSSDVTEDWLAAILSGTFASESVTITNLKDETPAEDESASDMKEIIVEVQSDAAEEVSSLRLMIKIIPPGSMENLERQKRHFERESQAYTTLQSYFEGWQIERLGTVEYTAPMPRCYHAQCDDQGHAVLVMENLKSAGYRHYPKEKGIDLIHAKIAIRELAKFHSMSIVMTLADPQDNLVDRIGLQCLNSAMCEELISKNKETRENDLKVILEILGQCPGQEANAKALETYLTSEEFNFDIAQFQRNPPQPLVILHGDFWTNHILFQYNESGQPSGMMMVDFESCRYGYQMDDVSYFVYTCTTPHFRKKFLNSLLQVYYDEMFKQLEKLGIGHYDYEYTFLEMLREFDLAAKFGFLRAATVLASMVTNELNSKDKGAKEEPIDRLIGMIEELRNRGVFGQEPHS